MAQAMLMAIAVELVHDAGQPFAMLGG